MRGQVGDDDVLGSYIRGQRQLADLSLRQLAAMTNVSNAYLSQIERGLHQPSVKVLRSIASALNLSGETLLAQAGLIDPESLPTKVTPDAEAAIVAMQNMGKSLTNTFNVSSGKLDCASANSGTAC